MGWWKICNGGLMILQTEGNKIQKSCAHSVLYWGGYILFMCSYASLQADAVIPTAVRFTTNHMLPIKAGDKLWWKENHGTLYFWLIWTYFPYMAIQLHRVHEIFFKHTIVTPNWLSSKASLVPNLKCLKMCPDTSISKFKLHLVGWQKNQSQHFTWISQLNMLSWTVDLTNNQRAEIKVNIGYAAMLHSTLQVYRTTLDS